MFFRKPKLPADARPDLAPDERVVAWAATVDGHVVATTVGLWLGKERRLRWDEISKASWSGSALTIVPGPAGGYTDEVGLVAEEEPVSFALTVPGEIPRQVHERVTRSVAYTSHHLLPGAPGGVRVLARRVPGINGLRWAVRFDAGVDPEDPAARAAALELVHAAQQEF
ncbi:hypothetical protein [Longispora albida]|uniref:hypothetical protein n=1 Tax=Longispora albida TaxID=203523 RepID=UPI00035ED56E|nr:hypothetical protein [Longispora albida]